jgi:histidine triad (HIT) family protein
MASVFTRIIDGELPARFVWSDERCVAFLSINPLKPGHVLVVPRIEVDHWLDLDADTWHHLTDVAQQIGAALQQAYRPHKVGMMLAGLEVPHVHIHLVPIDSLDDLDFGQADPDPAPADLDGAASRIRGALEDLGHEPLSTPLPR